MELSTQIFQFILSISILVVLHELGHFLPAKWFKTKVEKFYLFFDPWFSLVKKKVGGTEYGIGWLPLGGYVKIAGMVDESMDTEQLKKPAEPWEFRSKPAWQRLIIMLGGVTVNFFLAWFIYSALSYFNGETYTDMNKFDKGLSFSEAGTKMGFQQGDKIIKIDGKPVERLETSMINILFSDDVTVIRNGQEKTFAIDEHGIADVIKQREAKAYLSPRAPMILDSIVSESAQKAGLKKGDKVIAVNSVPTPFYDDVQRELNSAKGKKAYIYVTRNGQPVTIEAPVNAEGKLGVGVNTAFFQNITTTKEYSFTQSIGRGLTRTIDALTMQIKQFKIMFSSKVQGYKNVSGPIGIVKMMPEEINWPAFWSFTAMFSVWLAFLNLLPIPGLDGGHVMFTLWEMITGKPVPQKVLENAQMIGVLFLLGLMLLIFGSDIYKVITGKL